MYLELVSSLSTEAFLATLRRFMSHRGICVEIFSNNATNFVGANKEFQSLYAANAKRKTVQEILTSEEITWHFIPLGMPNFGGLCSGSSG